MDLIAQRDFVDWFASFAGTSATVYGKLPGLKDVSSEFNRLKLLEWAGRDAALVRWTASIPLASTAPSRSDRKEKPEADPKRILDRVAAQVLLAGQVVPPRVDPIAWRRLVSCRDRLRILCDASAFAQGVVQYIAAGWTGSVDVISTAIADAEIARWPSRHKNDFWNAGSLLAWQKRTDHELARRFLARPLSGCTLDRLSPDQSALLLAKIRDDGGRANQTLDLDAMEKAADADLLLVELGRSLVRSEPKGVKVLYLTADRDHARIAASAIGSDHVLLAARPESVPSSARVRGLWRPVSRQGAFTRQPLDYFLGILLSAFDGLEIELHDCRVHVERRTSAFHGCPSDDEDPVWAVDREQIGTRVAVQAPRPTVEFAASPDEAVPLVPVLVAEPSVDERDDWLLSPHQVGTPVAVAPGLFLVGERLFDLVAELVGHGALVRPAEIRLNDVWKCLIGLEWISSNGEPGPAFPELKSRWNFGDFDWIHSEFLRLPGYRHVMGELKVGNSPSSNRDKSKIAAATVWGQITRLHGEVLLGDSPLRASELTAALDTWLSPQRARVGLHELSWLVAKEFRVSPPRFERAMMELWKRRPDAPYHAGGTGGEIDGRDAHRVARLTDAGVRLVNIYPGSLYFGRKLFSTYLERRWP